MTADEKNMNRELEKLRELQKKLRAAKEEASRLEAEWSAKMPMEVLLSLLKEIIPAKTRNPELRGNKFCFEYVDHNGPSDPASALGRRLEKLGIVCTSKTRISGQSHGYDLRFVTKITIDPRQSDFIENIVKAVTAKRHNKSPEISEKFIRQEVLDELWAGKQSQQSDTQKGATKKDLISELLDSPLVEGSTGELSLTVTEQTALEVMTKVTSLGAKNRAKKEGEHSIITFNLRDLNVDELITAVAKKRVSAGEADLGRWTANEQVRAVEKQIKASMGSKTL